MQNSSSPQFDLTGKLIIKVALGDDIRRIPIHNEDITYDELVLMMQRVYRGKLSTNDEITIKYKDEDGDLITIFDSSDLTFAIQCSRILKITLFVGGPSKSLLEPSSVSSIRSELQVIRDRVLGLLDRLEPVSIIKGTQALSIGDGGSAKDDQALKLGVTDKLGSSQPVNALGGKEFDPLKSQKSVEESVQSKVAASFGVDGGVSPATAFDRAATPDSVSSIGSSSSNQVRAQQAAHQFQQQHQPSPSHQPQQVQQQPGQPPQQLPQQQQQQPQPPQQYPGQAGQMTQQPYAGQPGYGVHGQQMQHQHQPQQQPPHLQQPQQQQQPTMPHTSQPYDPNMYAQYNQGYSANTGPPGQPGMAQAPNMGYSQPGGPNPYGQTMPGRGPQMEEIEKTPKKSWERQREKRRWVGGQSLIPIMIQDIAYSAAYLSGPNGLTRTRGEEGWTENSDRS
ncbi:protein TFG [Elysia marginata]|uniref:Protein TFG n=1 Tax=Elysia marginata TaxID=1093978 RepID=A0AAV4FS13_9GAST|nr:protein TFG [Elysia marginata]